MACTGHSNTPNGVACTGHVPAVSPYPFSNTTISPGESVTAQDMDELRLAITQELTRRGTSYVMTNVAPNQNVLATHYREMRDALNACSPWTFPVTVDNTNLSASSVIFGAGIQAMKTRVQLLKSQCVCNCNYTCTCNCNYCTCDCNYCTCDCNYCTCDCNYCTCNCNYCTCDCNYTCTCNCNYGIFSDNRLKKDIEYL